MIASLLKGKRSYVVNTLSDYWVGGEHMIRELPIPEVDGLGSEILPPRVQKVILPQWAEDIGVVQGILVPSHLLTMSEEPAWRRVDWLATIFWYLNGSAERAFEELYGPIHSYSFRLKDWPSQLWERAWVNRIALFLRRWAARERRVDEEDLFGPLPAPEIILTHDVDTITKTLAIRLKQTAFHAFNTVRSLYRRRFNTVGRKLSQVVQFALSSDNYWCFDHILALEEKYNVRSHFNVYGGAGGWKRPVQQLLIDPAYNVNHPKLQKQLRRMYADGWTIGLHQSFNAWAHSDAMLAERIQVEQALDASVLTCRQHWLRFSWARTWSAQQSAGLELDSTLGFNDRPAFRNGAAIRFHPWDFISDQPMYLVALPMILMDSHLYDYADLTEAQRHRQIAYWLDEVRAVHGTATIIWHQRTMSNDYGWNRGYETLLSMIGEHKL